jgi:hypothetical protein
MPYILYNVYPLIRNFVVEASSELKDSKDSYSVYYLDDQSWRSWAEGVPGNGIGESFTITLSDDYHKKQIVEGFAIKNGNGNLNYYGQNNRVKSFKIYIDGKFTETIPIKDSISFEQYAFKESVTCESIRFEINDVYPGTKNDDTCVAEIALLKQKVSDSQFYENILFWLEKPGVKIATQYENNIEGIASISDIDKILLTEYLPFDSLFDNYNRYFPKKSKIAHLGSQSSLRLRDNLPRLDGATAMYPLYSSFVHAVYPEIGINIAEDEKHGLHPWELFKWPYFPNENLIYRELGVYGSFSENGEKFESIVQCNTTSEAYRRLIDGETDIIFCYESS